MRCAAHQQAGETRTWPTMTRAGKTWTRTSRRSWSARSTARWTGYNSASRISKTRWRLCRRGWKDSGRARPAQKADLQLRAVRKEPGPWENRTNRCLDRRSRRLQDHRGPHRHRHRPAPCPRGEARGRGRPGSMSHGRRFYRSNAYQKKDCSLEAWNRQDRWVFLHEQSRWRWLGLDPWTETRRYGPSHCPSVAYINRGPFEHSNHQPHSRRPR